LKTREGKGREGDKRGRKVTSHAGLEGGHVLS